MCTERWLIPGTEYAVPEKLPLPRAWYTERDGDVAAGADGVPSHGAADGIDVDESGECHHQHLAKYKQHKKNLHPEHGDFIWHRICFCAP